MSLDRRPLGGTPKKPKPPTEKREIVHWVDVPKSKQEAIMGNIENLFFQCDNSYECLSATLEREYDTKLSAFLLKHLMEKRKRFREIPPGPGKAQEIRHGVLKESPVKIGNISDLYRDILYTRDSRRAQKMITGIQRRIKAVEEEIDQTNIRYWPKKRAALQKQAELLKDALDAQCNAFELSVSLTFTDRFENRLVKYIRKIDKAEANGDKERARTYEAKFVSAITKRTYNLIGSKEYEMFKLGARGSKKREAKKEFRATQTQLGGKALTREERREIGLKGEGEK